LEASRQKRQSKKGNGKRESEKPYGKVSARERKRWGKVQPVSGGLVRRGNRRVKHRIVKPKGTQKGKNTHDPSLRAKKEKEDREKV